MQFDSEMAENVPSEETHVLQTCSGSRKQYLRGKVPVPKTTLWRSGYRKQLRSYKESSVQSVVEVPEVHLGASVDVGLMQSGLTETKEHSPHVGLEAECFEDDSDMSRVESCNDTDFGGEGGTDGGEGCGGGDDGSIGIGDSGSGWAGGSGGGDSSTGGGGGDENDDNDDDHDDDDGKDDDDADHDDDDDDHDGDDYGDDDSSQDEEQIIQPQSKIMH
eukprot:Em0023g929a